MQEGCNLGENDDSVSIFRSDAVMDASNVHCEPAHRGIRFLVLLKYITGE